ncbi:MAG: hypothetical protein ACRDOE_25190 [Streptosporangiaceae bacterium]
MKLNAGSGNKQVGGPYEGDGAEDGGQDDCGIVSPQQCVLDGAGMDCSMAWNLGTGGDGLGGPGGQGSPALQSVYACEWADCMGAENAINPVTGLPNIYLVGGAGITGPGQAALWVERVPSPGLAQCGWDLAGSLTFVGSTITSGQAAAPGGAGLGPELGPLPAQKQSQEPQPFWQRPGCGAALGDTGIGVVGTALTAGGIALAIYLGPEAFEGVEGAINLLHVAPAGLPGLLILGHGLYQTWNSCF